MPSLTMQCCNHKHSARVKPNKCTISRTSGTTAVFTVSLFLTFVTQPPAALCPLRRSQLIMTAEYRALGSAVAKVGAMHWSEK